MQLLEEKKELVERMAVALLDKEVLGTGGCWAQGAAAARGQRFVCIQAWLNQLQPFLRLLYLLPGHCPAEELEALLGPRPYRSAELRNIDK